ncbi:hypothetical protein chiPu_0001597 [Chiloscyllium punctatum]|uniref:Uncharacterized protein n=1 Tax=Chiloscyllium punctatum TaxID=137246 RepID=A0A401RYG8_CHIPU|nr:hypothetical protein [Chiloscyllium punctatum]
MLRCCGRGYAVATRLNPSACDLGVKRCCPLPGGRRTEEGRKEKKTLNTLRRSPVLPGITRGSTLTNTNGYLRTLLL